MCLNYSLEKIRVFTLFSHPSYDSCSDKNQIGKKQSCLAHALIHQSEDLSSAASLLRGVGKPPGLLSNVRDDF